MAKTQFLPDGLRQTVEQELKPGETIRWIEQPIGRVFTPVTAGLLVAGLLGLGCFGYFTYTWWTMPWGSDARLDSFSQWIKLGGLLVGGLCLLISCVPLAMPWLTWKAARQTVYLITNQRALIFQGGGKTTIHSYSPTHVREAYRNQRADGSGDVVIAVRQWIDSSGDVRREEIGFLNIRDPKAVEALLRSL